MPSQVFFTANYKLHKHAIYYYLFEILSETATLKITIKVTTITKNSQNAENRWRLTDYSQKDLSNACGLGQESTQERVTWKVLTYVQALNCKH